MELQETPKKIISLDPAFRSTGWSVWLNGELINWGCIHTEKTKRKGVLAGDDDVSRCYHIIRSLYKVIWDDSVVAMIVELTSGSKGSNAAKALAYARAIPASISEILCMPVEWVPQGEWKKKLFGKRNVSKKEVQEWVQNRFPDKEFPKTQNDFEHIADSIALFIASESGSIRKIFG